MKEDKSLKKAWDNLKETGVTDRMMELEAMMKRLNMI